MIGQPLRATRGLDSAGQKAINFGYPDRLSGGDGVNVDFFVYENTIQKYDPKRKYPVGFAVLYNDRIYVSQVEITAPEAFQPQKWKGTRVDPEWKVVTSTAALQGNLRQGEYVISQIKADNAVYTMPFSKTDNIPLVGDTIVIKDNGFALHEFEFIINGNGKNINGVPTFRLTRPGCTVVLIFNGVEWSAQIWDQGDSNKILLSANNYILGENFYRSHVGEHILRETQYGGGLRIRLPRYANHGDTISMYDLDGMNPLTKTEVFIYPGSNHKIVWGPGETPVDTIRSDISGWGMFIFDSRVNQWRIFDGDKHARWKTVQSSYTAVLGEKLAVYTLDPNTPITITLPPEAANGDSFYIDTSYMVQGSTIILQVDPAQTNDYIVPDDEVLTSPRVSKYRDIVKDLRKYATKKETLVIDNRASQWEFAYRRNANNTGLDVWTLVTNAPLPFRVDRSDTKFVGMAAIADQAEVNKNKEQITAGQTRDCEAFITPETLASKIATVTMRGITRLATDAESKATAGTTEGWNGVVITPERLNNRLATETMRGVLTVATQAQANAMSGSGEMWAQTGITPAVLNGRKSTETQTGITWQVIAAGTKQAERGTAGTGVHNFAEHYRYVTPKTLFEKVATDTSQGMGFVATQAEVNAGTADHTNGPLFVNASRLNARQATQTLTGLSRAVTDAEMLSNTPPAGDNIHATPGAIVKRTATEVRWGFAETATQAEVDGGALHDKYFVTPKTFGNWLIRERLTVDPVSGLTTAGNIWAGQRFNIQLSTEAQRGTLRVATQVETDAMVTPVDDSVVTPKKLNARQSSETLTGLIEIATQVEVNAGTDDNRAVTSKKLLTAFRDSANHRMTDARYGVGKMSTLGNDANVQSVWQGDDVAGSTRALDKYQHADFVVSPRGLNTALSHYLPIKAVAESTRNMDTADGTRVKADDWVRRTVDQTVTGALTLTQNLTISKNTCRLVLNDAATGHNTSIQYTATAKDTGWQTGVNVLDGSYTVGTLAGATHTPTATFGRDGTLVTTNQVANGGQDPTSANHLTRFNYTEGRYMRKTGALAETITGIKTFQNNIVLSAGTNIAYDVNIGAGNAGISVDANGMLSLGSTGTLYLRPKGRADATNHAIIDANGIFTASGQVRTAQSAPVAANDLTRKDYVDNAIDDVTSSASMRVNKKGDTMTGTLTIKAGQALVAEGNVDVKETLTAKNVRIAVGNGEFLELRPNATTRSIEFVWIS